MHSPQKSALVYYSRNEVYSEEFVKSWWWRLETKWLQSYGQDWCYTANGKNHVIQFHDLND